MGAVLRLFCPSIQNVITTLRHTEQSQHAALLVKAAQTIGFELPLQGFRPIREGKLREFEVGEPIKRRFLPSLCFRRAMT